MKPLFIATHFFFLALAPVALAEEKYHSADDAEVEFSLEEKVAGPQPFYIDKEAIENAKREKFANEQKSAKWMARRIGLLLAGIQAQKIAEQKRRSMERDYIAQNGLNDLKTDNPVAFAQAEQARALLMRLEVEARAVAALNAKASGSRSIASINEPPLVKMFKREPKGLKAKKLWAKFGRNLHSKFQTAARMLRDSGNLAMAQSGANIKSVAMVSRKIAPGVSSSLPLALQSQAQRQVARDFATAAKTTGVARSPASVARPKGQAAFTQQLKSIIYKVSKGFNQLKAKLFSW